MVTVENALYELLSEMNTVTEENAGKMRNKKYVIFAAVYDKLDFTLHLRGLLYCVYLFIYYWFYNIPLLGSVLDSASG